MKLPEINFSPITNEFATITARRVDIVMNEGYVYWDRADYGTDENGNFIEPAPEDISYSRARYNVSVTRDLSTIVIVPESEVPADQIDGNRPTQPTAEQQEVTE